MMKRKSIRLLGLLLALILALGLLPWGALSARAEEPEPTEITEVVLSVTIPDPGPAAASADGQVPAEVRIVSGEGCYVDNAHWVIANTETPPASFEAGGRYAVSFLLRHQEGYTFSVSTQISLSNAEIQSTTGYYSPEAYYDILTKPITVQVKQYDLWVGGVRVTGDNLKDILNDGGSAQFDPSSNTLSLSNAGISDVHEESGAQILAQGMNLNITGSAELKAAGSMLGISVSGGSLSLNGSFDIAAAKSGVSCSGDLIVENGSVTAETSLGDSTAIQAGGKITVKKGTVKATGTGCGILAGGHFVLEEGVVEATATGLDCDSESTPRGLQANDSVQIQGGDLTAKGVSQGLFGAKGILISGGTVLGEAEDCGILAAEGKLEIQNGITKVSAEGKGASGAIHAPEISLGDTLGITTPDGGLLSDDTTRVNQSDGSTAAQSVVIEPVGQGFTVTFYPGNGQDPIIQTVTDGGYAVPPEDPEMEGFSFEDWYEVLDPDADPFDFSTPIQGDVDLYAFWLCTVEGRVKDTQGNAGTGGQIAIGEEPFDSGFFQDFWKDDSGGPYVIRCKAADGFSFDHWEDGDGNRLAETGTSISYSPTEGSKVFVAVFKRDGFAVNFDGNGGSPALQTLYTYADGALDPGELEEVSDAMTREGYTLTGWSKTKDGPVFAIGSEIFDGDTTVYAVWSENSYHVKFVANGGSETAEQTVKHGQKATEPADPIRSGYSFAGWYKDQGLTQAFDFSSPITGDTTLYAGWVQVIKYTVISGGGSIYGKTSGKDLIITVRRNSTKCLEHFTGVKIDGSLLVLGTDYSVVGDGQNVVVTLNASYLSKLNSGTHIITFTFDDGKAVTGLTVKAGNSGAGTRRGGNGGDEGSPQTGDPGAPLLWTGLLLLSGLGLGAAALSGRKLRYQGKH